MHCVGSEAISLFMPGKKQLKIDQEARGSWSRYMAGIEFASQWMREGHCNQRQLAEALGESESLVSRFMSASMSYAPCRQRPAMMRVLEEIEALACDPERMWGWERDEAKARETDEAFWGYRLQSRIETSLADPSQDCALYAIRGLHVAAVHGPVPWNYYLSANLLLHIAEVLKRIALQQEIAHPSPAIVQDALGRVRNLERLSLKGFAELPRDWSPEYEAARVHGYAGHAKVWGGLLISERHVVDEGMSQMLDAALMPHRARSLLWPNLLRTIAILLERGDPGVEGYAVQVEIAVAHNENATVAGALKNPLMSTLRRYWASRETARSGTDTSRPLVPGRASARARRSR